MASAAAASCTSFLDQVEWPSSHPELPEIAHSQFESFADSDVTSAPNQLSDSDLLEWCFDHEHLRVVSNDVTALFCGGSAKSADSSTLASTLARRFHGGDAAAGDMYTVFIHDVRVSPSRAKGSGYRGFDAMTDDRVYADHALVRERIPRGLAFLQVCKVQDMHEVFRSTTGKAGQVEHTSQGWFPAKSAGEVSCLLRGLRKFTGRDHGDDDDTLPGAGQAAASPKDEEWQRFFTGDPGMTTHVAAMEKANGESGHFSAVDTPKLLAAAIESYGGVAPNYLFVGGSKTVHMIAQTQSDIEHPVYAGTRYAFARNILASCMAVIEQCPTAVQEQFVQFMGTLRITLCVEFLNPATQHVERFDFSHPIPQALTFVSSRPHQPPALTLGMHPIVAVRVAQYFGFNVVAHSLHAMSEHISVLQRTRYLYGKEGYVLYYMDAAGSVIGLVKRKSVWYIVQRAVREKARTLSRRIADICAAQAKLEQAVQGGARAPVLAAAGALQKLVDTAHTKAGKVCHKAKGHAAQAKTEPHGYSAAVVLAGDFAQGGHEMHPALLTAAPTPTQGSRVQDLQVLSVAGAASADSPARGNPTKARRRRAKQAKKSASEASAGDGDVAALVVPDCGVAAAKAALAAEVRGAAALMSLRLRDIQSWLHLSADTVAAYANVVLTFLQDVGEIGPSQHRRLFRGDAAAHAAAGAANSPLVSSTLVPTEEQADSAAQRVLAWMQDGWQPDLLGNRFPQMMSVFLDRRGINDNIDPIEASD